MELFHFDIETCGEYKNIAELAKNDSRGYKLFAHKYEKMEWSKKYNDLHEAYLENAPIISTYGKICCISCGYVNNGQNRIMSFYGKDEKVIVNSFNEMLKQIEKKMFKLCGYRVMYFDLPWLLHKLYKYGIQPANIIITHDKKPWEMRVVDLADDWKGKFAWSSSFDEVCYELNIASPKDNMNGSQVHSAYWKDDLESIKLYCESDIKSSIEVSKHIY